MRGAGLLPAIIGATVFVAKPVDSYADFVRLERVGRVVGIIPGGGWRASWHDDVEGDMTQDVIGWLVTDAGKAFPVVLSEDGVGEFTDSADEMIPPGSFESP
ncbi:hypothetical protein AB0E62_40005 [Streptomyces sp. NPDC038707]|uniref:hypothetical protein n=1 Tax=Streptomyces sp. NPDC038707 TaxID=3154329 RepID=UPI0033C77C06